MTRDEALALGRSAGGKAVKDKTPPPTCPRCNRSMAGRVWHSYLGHLGLHGLADRYFDGDLPAAQKRLQQNSLAVQDPAPWNRAWPKYRPVSGPKET
jgi:hypothetical protein